MSRRAWGAVALFGLVIVACGGAAVLGMQQRADARDREQAVREQLAEAIVRVERLRAGMETLEADQAALDGQADTLRQNFTPEVLAAVAAVEAGAIPGACDQARQAIRNDLVAPTGDAVVEFAAATAPATVPVLDDLPDSWMRMIDTSTVQIEIDRCVADETAIIEAEAAAAAAAAAAAEERFCGVPLFVEDYCPTQAEIDAEHQAEALCGGGRYDEALAAGIIC